MTMLISLPLLLMLLPYGLTLEAVNIVKITEKGTRILKEKNGSTLTDIAEFSDQDAYGLAAEEFISVPNLQKRGATEFLGNLGITIIHKINGPPEVQRMKVPESPHPIVDHYRNRADPRLFFRPKSEKNGNSKGKEKLKQSSSSSRDSDSDSSSNSSGSGRRGGGSSRRGSGNSKQGGGTFNWRRKSSKKPKSINLTG